MESQPTTMVVYRPKKQNGKNKRKKNKKNVNGMKFKKANVNTDVAKLRATDFRKIERNQLQSALATYHSYIRAQYLLGLVHPDIAVREQIPVKLPSELPIPTASIGYHVQNQFSTSALGTFLLSWRPSFLLPLDQLTGAAGTGASQLTFNNAVGLTGGVSIAGNNFVATGYYPAVTLQRYRLVSALLKISYNGSVFNQAGSMLACATFDPLVCACGNLANPVTSYSDGLVDRFGVFSLIQNGLWNTDFNITEDARGLEFLYVPTDPDDYTFQRAGTFYGTSSVMPGTFGPDFEGAHINYIVAGRNLPAGLSCVLVDTYYNYEVIADPSSAPILRSSVDSSFSASDRMELQDTLSTQTKKSGLIHPIKNNTTTSSTNWVDLFEKAVELGIKYIPTLF